MLSTKASRSTSRERAVSDAIAAPYLTHVVTHHGQITLVPPQNQGRIRTNKRPRKARATPPQPQETHTVALPVRSASPTSAISHRPKRVRERPRDDVDESTNMEDSARVSHGRSLRTMIMSEHDTALSSLPPPPCYESINSHRPQTPNIDVISLPSSNSSSDEFEDIAVMGFESQWELDRMAGFTLDERVQREWHRRQTVVEPTMNQASSASQGPRRPKVVSQVSSNNENTSRATFYALQRPGDHSSVHPPETSASTSHSVNPSEPSSPTQSPKKPTLKDIQLIGSSSKLTLEDWDVLELDTLDSTRSQKELPVQGPSVQDSYIPSSAISPVNVGSFSTGYPSSSKGTENPVGQVVQENVTDLCCREAGPDISLIKGKDRALTGDDEGKDPGSIKRSAIHSRPLPAPPLRPSRTTTITNPSVAPSNYSSLSFLGQPSATNEISSTSIPSDHAVPPPSNPFSSISDRITKFESMRDRPVPPPPRNFQPKRKRPPPPPPLFSSSIGVTDARRGLKIETGSSPVAGHVMAPMPLQATDDRAATFPSGAQDVSDVQQPSLSRSPLDLAGQPPSVPPVDRHACSPPATEISDNVIPPDMARAGPDVPPETTSAVDPSLVVEHSLERPESRESSSSLDGTLSPVLQPPRTSPGEHPLSQLTDLDILLSRLDDTSNEHRYEDLLLVSDILGPAQLGSESSSPSSIVHDLPMGKIEVMRRRKLQDGRVKLKLSLFGVVVDRCHVCLSQFKDAEWAVLLPCLHSYHSACLQSWLARSRTCPLCRISLNPPA
ncbi:hypothetical protein K439DRAFT_1416674 [Ramaria rubella]|nr:hypothetical protein K439DRAFT_1416674 [Ramaria rubella]